MAEQEEFVVVIDPGHGGMDGGAQHAMEPAKKISILRSLKD